MAGKHSAGNRKKEKVDSRNTKTRSGKKKNKA